MVTATWNPNAQTVAQVVTVTVSAVSIGGTLIASCNGKSITYTVVSGYTTTTAVSAWLTLLQNAAAAFPESGEITWSSAANVLTATATVPGTPFSGVTGNGFVFNATGGCTITTATTQVNVSPSERFGCPLDEAPKLAEALRGLEGLRLDGVMAIGPIASNPDEISRAFELAAKTFALVGGSTLSIGMSGDWPQAVRAGSTMIRIGTALFGGRQLT